MENNIIEEIPVGKAIVVTVKVEGLSYILLYSNIEKWVKLKSEGYFNIELGQPDESSPAAIFPATEVGQRFAIECAKKLN